MATRNDYLHCRMKPEDMEMLDAIVSHRGLGTRTTAVGFLIQAEYNRVKREASRMKPREQPQESAD